MEFQKELKCPSATHRFELSEIDNKLFLWRTQCGCIMLLHEAVLEARKKFPELLSQVPKTKESEVSK